MNAISPHGRVKISGENLIEFGDQLELTCSAYGAGPDNSFLWTLDGEELTESETVTIDTDDTSVLTISSNTFGDIKCTVTNDVGTGEKTVTVTGILTELRANFQY